MLKRALLLGSQTDGLSGVHSDLDAIGQRLLERGFELDVRSGVNATRASILDGYTRLIHDTRSGDAALFYYSGHGCRLLNPAARTGMREVVQCIVPTDWTSEGPFCGVTDAELSLLQARLTLKTDNVTSIFDCCHAATISRSVAPSEPVAKVTWRGWQDSAELFAALDETHAAHLHPESNLRAVRLGAAEADRSAYEMRHSLSGVQLRMGNLTWAICSVLDEIQTARVPWSSLLARVRELVLRLAPTQCPQLKGPSSRVLFTTKTSPCGDAVVFFLDQQLRPRIRASRLLGALVGSEYEVHQFSASTAAAQPIAIAKVVANDGATSLVVLSDIRSGNEPRTGDLAVPRRVSYPRLSVAVSGLSKRALELRTRVGQSRFVALAQPDERAHMELKVGDRIRLLGPERTDLVAPFPADAAAGITSLKCAERWSRAHGLLHLQSAGLPDSALEISWGRLDHGARVPMSAGQVVRVGDYIYVDLTNRWPRPLWIAIFDVGTTGVIRLLTQATPTGRKLEPSGEVGSRYTLGEIHSALVGIGPGQLPKDTPDTQQMRRESFVVIACEHPVDFFALETVEENVARRSGGLSNVVELFREGAQRDFGADSTVGAYRVTRIDFMLSPRSSAIASALGAGGSVRGIIAAMAPRHRTALLQVMPEALQPADILLSLGDGEVSEAIHLLDGGWYSHVGLWTGAEVIESIGRGVQCWTLEESVSGGHRVYLDVYRHKYASASQRARVVEHARKYTHRQYAWGDLLLGSVIVGSGAFVFRSSERNQRAWLNAMQTLNRLFLLDRERADEMVTCAELVARSYLSAEVPISINLEGLRRCDKVDIGAALAELMRDFSDGRKGGGDAADLVDEIIRFRSQLFALGVGVDHIVVPDALGQKSTSGAQSSVIVGVDWGPNLVTPRDLMQSEDLEFVGCLHPPAH